MEGHVELPVTLDAWLRVEDGKVTGVDLNLETVQLDHHEGSRTAFRYDGDIAERDLTEAQAEELLDSTTRHEWAFRRIEDSDGRVYLDE